MAAWMLELARVLDAPLPQHSAATSRLVRAVDLAAVGLYSEALSVVGSDVDLAALALANLDVLRLRAEIAAWTGASGDYARSLQLYEGLLPEMTAVLGETDEEVMAVRLSIVTRLGWLERTQEALSLAEPLTADLTQLWGGDHRLSIRAVSLTAFLAAKSGDLKAALLLGEDAANRLLKQLGPSHPETLAAQANVAYWLGETGRFREAIDQTHAVLIGRTASLGRDHHRVLRTRTNLAALRAKTGRVHEAASEFEALLVDYTRILGTLHVQTLKTRHMYVEVLSGVDPARARTLAEDLLSDREKALGADHPDAAKSRVLVKALSHHGP
jgi:hypothetical protein